MNSSARNRVKIFGIGFHKTGTTSLAEALRRLGYRTTGPNGVDDPDIATNARSMALDLTGAFDAFQDNPWPVLYEDLDAWHPGSKFILTVRDRSAWIASQVQHFGSEETPMRRWIYGAGCPAGHEQRYLERYMDHNRKVLEYFASRPRDLLVMDITDGDGWSKLCPFLGVPIPRVAFPYVNTAVNRRAGNRPGIFTPLPRNIWRFPGRRKGAP